MTVDRCPTQSTLQGPALLSIKDCLRHLCPTTIELSLPSQTASPAALVGACITEQGEKDWRVTHDSSS